jgi:acetylglutamate kinase
MQQLKVIKVGGNIIDNEQELFSFLQDFAQIEGAKILVHGGGKVATSIGDKLGIISEYVNGRRITDAAMLDVVTMVYGGLVNKKITAQLQCLGCNAIGLTGTDGNLMQAVKRPVKEIDYGFVGDIHQQGINAVLLQNLLLAGLVPVLAPLTHDGKGTILNTNADTIAQEVAKAMASIMDVQLIYCFEKKGLLINPKNDNSVLQHIDKSNYDKLKKEEIITGGMIPKLDNAFQAIECKVSRVVIGHATDLNELITGRAGTQIK